MTGYMEVADKNDDPPHVFGPSQVRRLGGSFFLLALLQGRITRDGEKFVLPIYGSKTMLLSAGCGKTYHNLSYPTRRDDSTDLSHRAWDCAGAWGRPSWIRGSGKLGKLDDQHRFFACEIGVSEGRQPRTGGRPPAHLSFSDKTGASRTVPPLKATHWQCGK